MGANAEVCLYDLQFSREIYPYFKLKILEFIYYIYKIGLLWLFLLLKMT